MKKTGAFLFFFAILSFSMPVLAGNWLDTGRNMLGSLLSGPSPSNSGLSQQDVIAGLKEALQVGSETVVKQLGTKDGFNLDPSIHIPLPEKFRKAQAILQRLQLSPMLDDLEIRLNRAAELATPKTKKIFLQAIKDMNFDDAMEIYKGPENAATKYFERKTSPMLTEAIRPVIDQSLQEAGAVKLYDQFIGKYAGLPLVPDLKSDLGSYVTEGTLAGIFKYLAKEEAAIRQNPAKRTTELLQKLFTSRKAP